MVRKPQSPKKEGEGAEKAKEERRKRKRRKVKLMGHTHQNLSMPGGHQKTRCREIACPQRRCQKSKREKQRSGKTNEK
jgi:hypothetical protein